MHVLTNNPAEPIVLAERQIEIIDDTGLSFDSFYAQNHRSVANALALTLGNRDLAAEATDEAMARAYARWGAVAHYANPAGWVYKVALNWSRSTLRRLARRPKVEVPLSQELSVVEDLALAEAIGTLDINMRSVVVCRYLLDWSVEDTALALNIKPGTVKSRLHRALKQLEQQLDAS